MEYINDERNKLGFYNNDIDMVIKKRINHLSTSSKNIKQIKLFSNDNGINQIYNHRNKLLKHNFLFRKINQKKLKAKNDF